MWINTALTSHVHSHGSSMPHLHTTCLFILPVIMLSQLIINKCLTSCGCYVLFCLNEKQHQWAIFPDLLQGTAKSCTCYLLEHFILCRNHGQCKLVNKRRLMLFRSRFGPLLALQSCFCLLAVMLFLFNIWIWIVIYCSFHMKCGASSPFHICHL